MPVQYTDDIIKFIREAGRPVTTREIADGVGMTRAAAYQWVDRNAEQLRVAGKGAKGATTYELVDPVQRGAQNGHVANGVTVATGAATAVKDVHLGDTFHVASMALDNDGRIVVTLRNEDGSATIDVIV